MRNLVLGLSLSVAFIVGCVAGPAIMPRTSAAPSAPAAPGTPKWEYVCYNGTSNLMSTFRKLGHAGWEMSGSSGGIGTAPSGLHEKFSIWCFKRRLP